MGVICQKKTKFRPQVGKSQPNTKSRLTSEPFKIDKKCQLNMNIKSGSTFRIRDVKQREVTPGGEIFDDVISCLKPRYIENHVSQITNYYGTLSESHGRSFRIRHVK